MKRLAQSPWIRDGLILSGLWSLVLLCDSTWIHLDHSVPAWDQGNHLNYALSHWRVLQSPHWLDGEWWKTLWQQAPTQRAPLVYLMTAPFFALWGRGFDQGMAVNLLFTLMLLVAVYLTGRRLFSRQVGLWAAALALLSPNLIRLRLDYLLDYGMTAVFAATFAALTYWWTAHKPSCQWGLAVVAGMGLGLCILTRTSALLFLMPPLIWAIARSLWCRHWQRLGQMGLCLVVGGGVIWPWFSLNWLTIISTTLQGSAYGVVYGTSPQASTLAGWLYYPGILPGVMVLWPILGSTLGLFAIQKFRSIRQGLTNPLAMSKSRPKAKDTLQPEPQRHKNRGWLTAFLLGIYILGSLGSNKVPRFLVPALPMLLIAFAQVLTWRDRPWQKGLRWGAITLSTIWVTLFLFPLPQPTFLNATVGNKWPYRGETWPNHEVIQALVEADPWLRPNLGMVVNTPEINPLNMDFYGGLANFQVNSRQLASDPETAEADAKALNWYLTKTDDQGAYNTIEAGQARLKALVKSDLDLSIHRQWTLPDNSQLLLHRRQRYPVRVNPLNRPVMEVALEAVEVPETIAVGQATPITYTLQGPWPKLTQGALLLTWESLAPAATDNTVEASQSHPWISDHGIGLGQLYAEAPANDQGFEVVEQLSVFPPADTPLGEYRLKAQYLDRETQAVRSLPAPEVTVQLVASQPAPEPEPTVDLVTRLRQLSAGLETGGIDPVFKAVGPINQYDPHQDYLVQTELLMQHRLTQEPDNLKWLYSLLLAQILQQEGADAIETLQQITQITPENPYAWAYLTFVNVYQWRPHPAQKALEQVIKHAPDLTALPYLEAGVALQQLNLVKFFRTIQAL
ncbi:MAG: glycosyltransferase family 39 protein [Leptolyngbyaceae cyanobacterium]